MLAACSHEEEFVVSSDAILFGLSSQQDMETRAYHYDNASLYLEEKGGGNFTVQAFVDHTSTKYIDSRVWYIKDGNRWWFRQGNSWYDCYWPKNNKLSFFAYMPWQPSGAAVTIDNDSEYTFAGGPVFSCNLPLDITSSGINQENLYEFIYAYTKDRRNELVELNFVHPMSSIEIWLKQSHRDLTIHHLGFKNVYNQGSFSYAQETTEENETLFKAGFTYERWTPEGKPDKVFDLLVEKNVPEDLNFDSKVGGPFIVMPQRFSRPEFSTDPELKDYKDVKLFVSYTWDGNTYNGEVALDAAGAWQPGYKYTYYLDLGDNKEEILFRVLVEPWDVVGFKNKIDID